MSRWYVLADGRIVETHATEHDAREWSEKRVAAMKAFGQGGLVEVVKVEISTKVRDQE